MGESAGVALSDINGEACLTMCSKEKKPLMDGRQNSQKSQGEKLDLRFQQTSKTEWKEKRPQSKMDSTHQSQGEHQEHPTSQQSQRLLRRGGTRNPAAARCFHKNTWK